MDVFSRLKIGEKIDINLRENMEQNAERLLHSQIVDMEQDIIYIANTISGGVVHPLEVGQKVTVIFYRDERGIYSFLGEIVKKIHRQNIFYGLKPVGVVQKIQRRSYYRLPIVRKLLVRNQNQEETTQCITKNISGGGLKAISKNNFEAGEIVEMALYLDDKDLVKLNGKVVRSSLDPSKNEYELGIRFEDMDEGIRNKLIAFIFKQQRLLRKKGMI